MNKNNMSQVKSSEVKSNQIKSNQIKSYTHMMIRIRIRIRIIDGRKLRIITSIIITTTLKTIRLARMIMRMIKALRVTGVNIIITIKLRIIRIARVITIIIRMRISAMTIEKK